MYVYAENGSKVLVNSFLHFPVHNIRLSAKPSAPFERTCHFWSRNSMGILHLVSIHMQFLLFKSLGLSIHTNPYAYAYITCISKIIIKTLCLPFVLISFFMTLDSSSTYHVPRSMGRAWKWNNGNHNSRLTLNPTYVQQYSSTQNLTKRGSNLSREQMQGATVH